MCKSGFVHILECKLKVKAFSKLFPNPYFRSQTQGYESNHTQNSNVREVQYTESVLAILRLSTN